MKLATKTTKEIGKQIITTANKYISTNYYTSNREQPDYRTRLEIDENNGQIIFTVEQFFWGKWSTKYSNVIFTNVN